MEIHSSAIVDPGAAVGTGTRIWHFSHVASGAVIGERCVLGQNVYVAPGVRIGNNVRIQNNVSVYSGVELEDDVFCGPSCVFTNVSNPRAEINRRLEFRPTLVRRGATLGANATVVCGSTVGRFAFVAAGSVLARGAVPDYALMMGVPAKRRGWVSRHGHALQPPGDDGITRCPESGFRYREVAPGVLRCLDRGEDEAL